MLLTRQTDGLLLSPPWSEELLREGTIVLLKEILTFICIEYWMSQYLQGCRENNICLYFGVRPTFVWKCSLSFSIISQTSLIRTTLIALHYNHKTSYLLVSAKWEELEVWTSMKGQQFPDQVIDKCKSTKKTSEEIQMKKQLMIIHWCTIIYSL